MIINNPHSSISFMLFSHLFLQSFHFEYPGILQTSVRLKNTAGLQFIWQWDVSVT